MMAVCNRPFPGPLQQRSETKKFGRQKATP